MEWVIVERELPQAVNFDDIRALRARLQGCADIYRVEHVRAYLSRDGHRLDCVFRAPDAESVRTANRNGDAPFSHVYSATMHGPEPDLVQPESGELVLVTRSWEQPVAFDDVQAQEDAFAWCLQQHRVKFLRSYFAKDRRRMLCLYAALDAESVRTANRTAGLPFDNICSVSVFKP